MGLLLHRQHHNGTCSVLAGGRRGTWDGRGHSAEFDEPCGIVVDSHDNIYVADRGNHSIRKITLDGCVTTIAGAGRPGFMDGTGPQALFHSPRGLALDIDGISILVADQENHAIRRVKPDGAVETVVGLGVRGCRDGPIRTALLSSPRDVAVDAVGNIYITDHGNMAVHKVTPDGRMCSTATGGRSIMDSPKTVTVDDVGQLYLTDESNGLFLVDCRGRVSLLAGAKGSGGRKDGPLAEALFLRPCGLAVLGGGQGVVLADFGNNAIRLVHGSSKGAVVTLATGLDPPFPVGGPRHFRNPWGVAVTRSGDLVITDMLNYRVCLYRCSWLQARRTPAPHHPPYALPRAPRRTSQDLHLLSSGEFSDITFLIEGQEVKAHRAILATRSQYFRALLCNGMAESSASSVVLPDTDLAAFTVVLRYLYTGRLQLQVHSVLEVLVLCRQYVLEQGTRQCIAFVVGHAEPALAAEWLLWAHQGGFEELKAALLCYCGLHFREIQEAGPAALEALKAHPDLLLEVMTACLA